LWLLLVAVLFAVTEVFVGGPGPRDAWRWVGLTLALIGVAGVISARYTLGRSFSVTPQARKLVTGGIYSKIRNPIYVTSGVLFVGVLLILREPRLWLVLVVLVPMQIIRARKEAQVLEAKFGDEYRRYRAGTWF
jgi:protein-S-isoprenylcysteine O-methyltransferase Ste14